MVSLAPLAVLDTTVVVAAVRGNSEASSARVIHEVATGVIVDFDRDERPVGIEIYDGARAKLAGTPLWKSEDERALEIGRAWIAGYRAGYSDREAEQRTEGVESA